MISKMKIDTPHLDTGALLTKSTTFRCFQCLLDYSGLAAQRSVRGCAPGATHDRDMNAAVNIERIGVSTLGLGDVRPAEMLAIAA